MHLSQHISHAVATGTDLGTYTIQGQQYLFNKVKLGPQ